MPLSTWLLSCLLSLSAVSALGPASNQFKNLITFGDSYTDVGSPGDNATAWPVYAALYGNLTLYPFAKSGAVCSKNLTNRPFPSVKEYQIPTLMEELSNGTLGNLGGESEESVYTLWIGTNDVGRAALITGDQVPGVTLVNVVECAVSWVQTMYDSGARNFLFQNVSHYRLSEGRKKGMTEDCVDAAATKDHSLFERHLSEPLLDVSP